MFLIENQLFDYFGHILIEWTWINAYGKQIYLFFKGNIFNILMKNSSKASEQNSKLKVHEYDRLN